MSATPILHTLHAVDPASAQGAQKDILELALKAVGFLPNMYLNMANAPAVLSTYLHGYALFRSESGLKPAEQEVELLIFGNPQGGTPFLDCAQTVGIDLPLKALVWEDTSAQVWLGYNDTAYLAKRHDVPACAAAGNLAKAAAAVAP